MPWILVGIAALATSGLGEPTQSTDLATLLHWRSQFWEQSRKETQTILGADDSAWHAGRGSLEPRTPLHFGDLVLDDSRLLFDRGRPLRFESTLYRQDRQGRVSLGWILEQFAAATNAASRWADSEPMAMTRPEGWHAWVWGRSPHIVAIEWYPGATNQPTSGTTELRLVAEPWPPRTRLESRIVRNPAGDRYLRVPMVIQQRQGFCAPATLERVLRYYGIPLAASSLEQLAESTPETGTNVQRMLDKLVRLRTLRCELRELFGFDLRRFDRVLADYNTQALRQGKPALAYSPPLLDLARVFAAADPELLRTVMSAQPGRRKFWRELRRSIDRGQPLLWGVVLGIVPENGLAAQTQGGHLRLIVGYNKSASEVLFSDSWGVGHELKRLSLEDAWRMTMTLHALAPPG